MSNTLDYYLVDIANNKELLEALMCEVVNHDEFPYVVSTACEIERGEAFVRLVQELARNFAIELMEQHKDG